jgi:hypothetical protein
MRGARVRPARLADGSGIGDPFTHDATVLFVRGDLAMDVFYIGIAIGAAIPALVGAFALMLERKRQSPSPNAPEHIGAGV